MNTNRELNVDWKTVPAHLRPTHASFLLSNFVLTHVRRADRCVELGCGVGAITFTLARSGEFQKVLGIDRDPEAISIAKKLNLELGFEKVVDFLEMDVSAVKGALSPEGFDAVVMNPPFHLRGQRSHDRRRDGVRSADSETVKAFIDAAFYLLKNKGELYISVKPFTAVDFFELMLDRSMEPKLLQPVYGRGDRDAFLLLVKATKNGGRELRVLPPVILS